MTGHWQDRGSPATQHVGGTKFCTHEEFAKAKSFADEFDWVEIYRKGKGFYVEVTREAYAANMHDGFMATLEERGVFGDPPRDY